MTTNSSNFLKSNVMEKCDSFNKVIKDREHFKKEESSKTNIIRQSFLRKMCFLLLVLNIIGGCKPEDNGNDDNSNGTDVSVTNITLNKTTLTLTEGNTEILTATVTPENATNKDVVWKSSNTSIASVANGVVTAVAAGTTTITVSSKNGHITTNCILIVIAPLPGSAMLFISGSGTMTINWGDGTTTEPQTLSSNTPTL